MRTDHDPIEQAKERILKMKYASEDDLKEIEKDIRAVVADAAEFAQNDPLPAESELYTDILL